MAQTNRQTHTQTDGHGNSMTEPAPWKSCQILADQLVFHCWIYHHSLMITCWSVISHQIQPLIWNRRGGYILPETAGATQSTGGSTGSLWRSGQCNHSPGRTGLNLAHKKHEFSTFCAWHGGLTIITLLKGQNVMIWRRVTWQPAYPFNNRRI